MIRSLSTIERIYIKPLVEESSINLIYATSSEYKIQKLHELKEIIDVVVENERNALGIMHIRPLNLSREKAKILGNSIKSNNTWQQALEEIIQISCPDLKLSKEDLLASINRPWWNSNVLSRNEDSYNEKDNSLTINASLVHTYITQMSGSLKLEKTKTRPMSISGIIRTADGIMPLGLRGGQSFYDVVMTTPAGSVDYHSGKNPLFETMYAETLEELGLERAQLTNVELIGSIHENVLSNYSYYIFRAKTSLTFSELLETWNSAIDNREHKHLIPVIDHADYAIRLMRNNPFKVEYINENNVAATTIENVNTLLPQAIASLLVYYGQQEGKLWSIKSCGLLNNMYDVND